MNARITSPALLAALLLAVAGCAASVDAPSDGATLRSRLVAGETFDMAPEEAELDFTANIQIGTSHHVVDMSLGLVAGAAVVRTDAEGRIVFDVLDLELDDIVISPENLPPAGMVLSDVRFSLADAVIEDAVWSEDGTAVTANLQGDILVDWSYVRNGEEHLPLAQQVLRGVQVSLRIESGPDGKPILELTGAAPGTFFRWQEFVALDDLSLSLSGAPTLR